MANERQRFFLRAQVFERQLREGIHPNATSLSRTANCSKNTAQRTIDKLRKDYRFPIEFDAAKRGYYLTDRYYNLPMLTASSEELTSLLLLHDVSRLLKSTDLQDNIRSLWLRFSSRGGQAVADIEKLGQYFSAHSTAVAFLTGKGVLEYLDAAASEKPLRIEYQSPWRHASPKSYEGWILKVIYHTGSIYLRFLEKNGRRILLNVSFIKRLSPVDSGFQTQMPFIQDDGEDDSFGVWEGSEIIDAEITFTPQASHYYEQQEWHERQRDRWVGGYLIRTFPCSISPETIHFVLGLGRGVLDIKPKELKNAVLEELSMLSRDLLEKAPQ